MNRLKAEYAPESNYPSAAETGKKPRAGATDALRQASKNNNNSFEKSILLNPMLSKGMPEGLDLALELLQDSKLGYSESERIARNISIYFGVIGNSREITEWLAKNKRNMRWNSDAHRFVL